jgi:hypothetical protein
MNDLQTDSRAAIREMVRFANELINHRLSWLGTLQGLLFAALAFAWKDAGGVVYVVCSVGLLVALSTGVATHDANKALDLLERRFDDLGYDEASSIETLGVRGRNRGGYGWLMPGKFLPWLFALAWLVLFLLFLLHTCGSA